MAHYTGELIQNNEVIGYILWNGTVDMLRTCKIHGSEDEAWQDRQLQDWVKCDCARPQQEALLFVYLHHWPVKFCPTCRVIVTNRTDHEVQENCTACGTCGKELGVGCMDWSHAPQWPRPGNPIDKSNTTDTLKAP